MPEEFEEQDLRDAVFWSVDLRGALLRDVDLTGVRVSHARVVDVDIDGLVDRLTVNGVDVTDFVNERDPWHPLRAMLEPPDGDGMQAAWRALEDAWAPAIEQARALPDGKVHESVGGEWSFVQTLRHLVFATDKWFTAPVLGEGFHPIGLPNTGSIDFGWPGLDLAVDPGLDEALAVRSDRSERLRRFLDTVTDADLEREVEVLENGTTPVRFCIHVVFEEQFQHLRYAVRDLALLG